MDETKIKINKFNNIKNKIETFSKNEFNEIYLLLKKNNESFSTNRNGVLFDLFKLKEDTIDKIENFIQLQKDNNISIQKNETLKEQFKTCLK